jgi:hypothetical protein
MLAAALHHASLRLDQLAAEIAGAGAQAVLMTTYVDATAGTTVDHIIPDQCGQKGGRAHGSTWIMDRSWLGILTHELRGCCCRADSVMVKLHEMLAEVLLRCLPVPAANGLCKFSGEPVAPRAVLFSHGKIRHHGMEEGEKYGRVPNVH